VILGVFLAEPTKETPPMALDKSVLSELLDAFRTGEGLDLIKEAAALVCQELIEVELTAQIGADRYERTGTRSNERNGHRPRVLSTKAGDVELAIPKLRKGSFFPSILEPRRRIDQALYAVVMEAYVHGVSTRAVDELMAALGVGSGISRSEVSRICAGLDEVVDSFRERRLDHVAFPYVYLDATVRHEAPTDRVGGKDPPAACRSRPLKLEAARPWRRRRRWEQPRRRRNGSALPDGPGPASKTERCNTYEPVVEPPQARDTGSNLADLGRTAADREPEVTGRADWHRQDSCRRRGHEESLRRTRGWAAGEKLGTNPVDRSAVNVGTTSGLPFPPTSQVGGGQARRQLLAPRWDGVLVVVRGRESRLHGEGGQRDRSNGTGKPGGRR
jgi:putative transposase